MSLLQLRGAADSGRHLTDHEKDAVHAAAITAIRDELTPRVIIDRDPATLERAQDFLVKYVRQQLVELTQIDPTLQITELTISGLATGVYHQVFGLGFLERYLPPARTDLSEVAVLPNSQVTIQRKGSGQFELTGEQVPPAVLSDVINRLLGPMNRRVDHSRPIESTRIPPTQRLPTGARIFVVGPPVTSSLTLNVRLYESETIAPQQMLDWGSVTPEMDAFLAQRITEGCGLLVSGATGSGKTTFLNYLSYYIPQYDRVITVEDAQELRLSCPAGDRLLHGFWVHMETRPPNLEGQGEITFLQLVNTSLRMTPRWVIVGEIREGPVAAALLQTQLSGHSGMTTIHSDSANKAIQTLLMRCQQSDLFKLAEPAKRAITLGLDLVIQLVQERSTGRRYVSEIAMVEPQLHGGKVKLRPLWYLNPEETEKAGAPVWFTPASRGRVYDRSLVDEDE